MRNEKVEISTSDLTKYRDTFTEGNKRFAMVWYNDDGTTNEKNTYSEAVLKKLEEERNKDKENEDKDKDKEKSKKKDKKEGCLKKIILAPFRLVWWIIKMILKMVGVWFIISMFTGGDSDD